jgi:hypothetical protein
VYRENQFGKPVQLFNIQWSDTLPNIKKGLTAQGWEEVPRANLIVIINRIAASDRTKELPLFPMLHHGHKPILIMTKLFASSHHLVVLRLWDAKLKLTTNNIPLWLGIVSKKKITPFPNVSASELLVSDLKSFEWKIVIRPDTLCLSESNSTECNDHVLLIRQPNVTKKHKVLLRTRAQER